MTLDRSAGPVSTRPLSKTSKGKRVEHPLLTLRWFPDGSGLVVRAPRKLGGAVVRNRAKRQVKAALRESPISSGRAVLELKETGKTFQEWQGALHEVLEVPEWDSL